MRRSTYKTFALEVTCQCNWLCGSGQWRWSCNISFSRGELLQPIALSLFTAILAFWCTIAATRLVYLARYTPEIQRADISAASAYPVSSGAGVYTALLSQLRKTNLRCTITKQICLAPRMMQQTVAVISAGECSSCCGRES